MTTRRSGVNGYEVYDGNMVHKMPSHEDDLSSPPGGPAIYAPDKLKAELEKIRDLYWMEQKKNEELEKEKVMRDSGNVEDFKDTQIRQLTRQVTIHQAEVYKKEQKLEEVEKDKKDVENQLQSMTMQFELAKQEAQSLKEQNRKLEEELSRMVQKEKTVQLMKESRDSLSPPSSASLQSLSSNPNYTKELEVLHTMVDSLKQTVIQQRKVFEKFGFQSRIYNSLPQPQVQVSRPSQPSQHPLISSNVTSMSTLPARQVEGVMEGAINPSQEATISFSGQQPPRSPVIRSSGGQQTIVAGAVVELPANSGGSGNFQQALAYSVIQQGKGTVNDMVNGSDGPQVRSADGSSGDVANSPRKNLSVSNLVTEMGGLSVSCSSSSGVIVTGQDRHDGIYVNVENPGGIANGNQRGATAELTNCLHNGNVKDSSVSRSSLSSPQKTSHTEIINRRPQLIDNSSLPVKYGTENLGRNPKLVTQPPNVGGGVMLPPSSSSSQLEEAIRPPRPRDNLSLYQRGNVTYPPSATVAAADPRFGSTRLPHTWPSGHQQRVPETQFGAGTAMRAPPTPHTNSNAISDTNSSVHRNASGRPQDDRLCPVCNQNFSHISMESFQTHVFDCFDNENGPETLQPEMVSDYPPPVPNNYRTCPMCQEKFEMTMSQTEFEQHVHRHFGEERFEVIH